MLKLLKEPLLHLILIGVIIYGGWRFFQSQDEGVETAKIHVNARQIDGMVVQWKKRWNRPPTREEIDGLIQKYVREEILYRQAVAMGLDKNDPVTRLRTVQKLEFLTNDLAAAQQPADAERCRFSAGPASRSETVEIVVLLVLRHAGDVPHAGQILGCVERKPA